MSKRRRNSSTGKEEDDSFQQQKQNDEDEATYKQYQRLMSQRRLAEQIPISLNKMSLRIRLEAYYTLIAPDTLSNRREWLHRYDQIYDKYGGSYGGEKKLARNLAKKYGVTIQLKVATPEPTNRNTQDGKTENVTGNGDGGGGGGKSSISETNHGEAEKDEWYSLRPSTEEEGSGDVNFLSTDFDPHAALISVPTDEVLIQNKSLLEDAATGTTTTMMIFDNVDKCTTLLPEGDPLRRNTEKFVNGRSGSGTSNNIRPGGSNANKSKTTGRHQTESMTLHPFDDIAHALGGPGSRAIGTLGTGEGPFSTLFRMQNKRITVVIRYFNSIRGTMTGTLVAFDKHFNMIMKNVDEVYSPRYAHHHVSRGDEDDNNSSRNSSSNSSQLSNMEIEIERRRRLTMGSGGDDEITNDDNNNDDDSDDEEDGKTDHKRGKAEKEEASPSWNVRQRHMKQLLVRGDMVVSVYEANAAGTERSHYKRSRYHNNKKTMAITTTTETPKSLPLPLSKQPA
mmetsp:Transcript_32694/g.79445  ORF Transcript_32694/g.79445 Transcript_32694/m.79445 type:complete len:508 (+) Transcript_32694:64-1587(+)